MAKTEQFTSDIDDTVIEPGDLVLITVTRAGDTKTIHISDDQLADLMEGNEVLEGLILSD